MTTDFANPDERAEVTRVRYRADRAERAEEEGDSAKSSFSSFHIPSLDGLRAPLFSWSSWATPCRPRFALRSASLRCHGLLRAERVPHHDAPPKGVRQNRHGEPARVLLAARLAHLAAVLRRPPVQQLCSPSCTPYDGKVTLPSLGAYVLHAANYWHIYRGLEEVPGGTSVYWSLSVEEHFYLLFPMLYWAMRRWKLSSRQQLGVIVGLCGGVLAWRLVLSGVLHADHERLYRGTDTRVDAILAGCALAVYGNPVLDRSRISDRMWRWIGLPLGAIVLAITSLVRQPLFQDAVKGSLQAAALIPFFVVAIRCPKWGPMRILNTRIMGFIGLLSYGLYLSHRTILLVVDRWITSNLALQVPVALGIAVAFCYGMYVLVEQPAAQLRKRLAQPKRAPRPPKRMPTPMQPIAIG